MDQMASMWTEIGFAKSVADKRRCFGNDMQFKPQHVQVRRLLDGTPEEEDYRGSSHQMALSNDSINLQDMLETRECFAVRDRCETGLVQIACVVIHCMCIDT